ncbi:hypothetical protein G6F21_013873 [Rhizopus arrhizus]|nr:hypothetical protein G6F21_013873 [Rhizopus arrhizus]
MSSNAANNMPTLAYIAERTMTADCTINDPSRNLTVETVNHSKTFRDPKTGACTNTIEGTWNGIKRGVTSRHRTASMMPWKLVEFIWRRKHAGDHWKAMLACFSQVSFTRAGIADQGPLVSLLTV